MAAFGGVGQWYGGPGRSGPPEPRRHGNASARGASCQRRVAVRCGAVGMVVRQARPPYPGRAIRIGSGGSATIDGMHPSTATVPNRGGRAPSSAGRSSAACSSSAASGWPASRGARRSCRRSPPPCRPGAGVSDARVAAGSRPRWPFRPRSSSSARTASRGRLAATRRGLAPAAAIGFRRILPDGVDLVARTDARRRSPGTDAARGSRSAWPRSSDDQGRRPRTTGSIADARRATGSAIG